MMWEVKPRGEALEYEAMGRREREGVIEEVNPEFQGSKYVIGEVFYRPSHDSWGDPLCG